jgi:hypothetical protein
LVVLGNFEQIWLFWAILVVWAIFSFLGFLPFWPIFAVLGNFDCFGLILLFWAIL